MDVLSEPPETRSLVPIPLVVERIVRHLPHTASLELRTDAAGGGFAFAPGQFNMLYAFGVGEAPISVSGDPARPETLVHTIRAVGSVTRALLATGKGGVVGVRGPFGSRWPPTEARGHDVLVVAGGIGLAPLRPVVYHVLANRGEYGRLMILYGARTPADILFRDELERWSSRLDVDVDVTVDRASDAWFGTVGVVTRLIERTAFDPDETIAFVCGPEVMMRYAIASLNDRGQAGERIWLSMERNMRCAVGSCGHCQFGPAFVCRDGPVFRFDRIERLFRIREL